MEYEFDCMMNFESLSLYYEVHIADLDGECFNYSIYFEDGCTNDKYEEIDNAIGEFVKSSTDYVGYIDISKTNDKISIYHDIGNVHDEDGAIYGILKAFNNVSGIKSVIINEI